MARIRTIKPDFFLHEGIAELPAMTRLLFIGLWTQADREGRLEDRPKRLKASLFPYDNCDIEKLLNELDTAGFILRYKVNANHKEDISPRAAEELLSIIQIINFSKHQVCNVREQPSTLPSYTSTVQAQYMNSTSTVQAPQEGKGREGKGKEQEGEEDSPGESPPEIPEEPPEQSEPEFTEEEEEFVIFFKNLLPEKCNLTKNFKSKWIEVYRLLLKKDKRTKEQIYSVCQRAREDVFWQNNFYSPAKLRDRNKDGIYWYDYFLSIFKIDENGNTGFNGNGAATAGKPVTDYQRRRSLTVDAVLEAERAGQSGSAVGNTQGASHWGI